MTQKDAERWAAGFEAVVARMAPYFGRVELRRRALAYLRGVLSAAGAQAWLAVGRASR
jgi:hypothetical protein